MINTNKTQKVLMVCPTEEVGTDLAEMLRRVSSAMSAVDTYYDKCCELDEDAPDFEEKFAPVLNRLTLTLMQIYPNPGQMRADIKSIGDFAVVNK